MVKPWFIFKQYHVLVKVTVLMLLLSLVLHLLYSTSTTTNKTHSSVGGVASIATTEEVPFLKEIVEAEKDDDSVEEIQENTQQNQVLHRGKCDLFVGEWIPDPLGPMYTNESCNVITGDQDCMSHGRPDSGYLYWRWKPRDCELPRFNAARFLDSMRNKHWGFVGDSISRNHVQSLLCILSKVEAANDVYHDEVYRDRRWHFPTYNFSLSVIWSPFLVKAISSQGFNGGAADEIQLYLDELDKSWTDQYASFDYMVMSGGKWFQKTAIYYENNTIIGCHNCTRRTDLTEYGLDNGYRKATKQVFDFLSNYNHNATVLYRTTTAEHFENGNWDTGGTCDRKIPFKEGEISLHELDIKLRNVELEAFENLKIVRYPGKREVLKMFDVTNLSLLRPDGHPGPYRNPHPFAKDNKAKVQYDCLHWCLPGPIDSWNDLIMEMVMNG
ncbi:hypothetical protein MKW92_035451 [Papaver armeniacum]|nr:hypothetical protein MKW92_035451 [Papaver armeniacum]